MTALARTIEALLFLSSEPVTEMELLAACECSEEELAEALTALTEAFAPGRRGLELRELAGGWTLATAADTEAAARRLLSKPRTPPLSPAQAETLAIIAYLQPVSRPEITRIRGVSADSPPRPCWSAASSRSPAARPSAPSCTARPRSS